MLWDRTSVPAIIKPWLRLVEKDVLTAYPDAGGVETIATGSTIMPNGSPVRPGDRVTQAQDDAMLDQQIISIRIPAIVKAIPACVPLTESMAAMLIELTYNEGNGVLAPGNVITEMLVAQLFDRGFGQYPGWCIATQNGVRGPSLGLLRRREAGRRIALGAPVHPTYEQVWQLGMAPLLPLYQAACKDAAAWRNGVVTWEVHAVPLPPAKTLPTAKAVAAPALRAVHPAPVPSDNSVTDALNAASAAGTLNPDTGQST